MRIGDQLIYERMFFIGRMKDDFYKHPLKVFVELSISKGKRQDWEDLKEKESHIISFSGVIITFNGSLKDGRGWFSAGQINGTLKCALEEGRLFKKQAIRQLVELWEKYHLNDLKAGTKRQEEKVKEYFNKGLLEEYDYGKVAELLKKDGLYEDNGYRYGSAWLTMPVSKEEVENIIKFMEDNFSPVKK